MAGLTVPKVSARSQTLTILAKLTHFEASIKIRPFQRHGD